MQVKSKTNANARLTVQNNENSTERVTAIATTKVKSKNTPNVTNEEEIDLDEINIGEQEPVAVKTQSRTKTITSRAQAQTNSKSKSNTPNVTNDEEIDLEDINIGEQEPSDAVKTESRPKTITSRAQTKTNSKSNSKTNNTNEEMINLSDINVNENENKEESKKNNNNNNENIQIIKNPQVIKSTKVATNYFDKYEQVTNSSIRFNVKNSKPAIVNAMRRTMLSNVSNVAFEFNMKLDSDVKIEINTTSLHNEFYKHRLALIPLNFTADEIYNFQKVNYKFVLDKQNTTNDTVNVTTEDFKILDFDGNEYDQDFVRRIFPADPYTNEFILLTKLKPNIFNIKEGNQLKFEAYATIDTPHTFTGFSMVSLCSYFNEIDHDKANKAFEDQMKKEEITGAEKEHKRKEFDVMDIERHFVTNDYNEPSSFIFQLESECAIKPSIIFFKGFMVLIKQLLTLKNIFVHPNSPDLNIIETVDLHSNKLQKDSKITIYKPLKDRNIHVMVLQDEDDTLGNLIQVMFYDKYIREEKRGKLTYIGYNIEHPLKKHLTMKFDVTDDVTSFTDFMVNGLDHIVEVLVDYCGSWINFSELRKDSFDELNDFDSNNFGGKNKDTIEPTVSEANSKTVRDQQRDKMDAASAAIVESTNYGQTGGSKYVEKELLRAKYYYKIFEDFKTYFSRKLGFKHYDKDKQRKILNLWWLTLLTYQDSDKTIDPVYITTKMYELRKVILDDLNTYNQDKHGKGKDYLKQYFKKLFSARDLEKFATELMTFMQDNMVKYANMFNEEAKTVDTDGKVNVLREGNNVTLQYESASETLTGINDPYVEIINNKITMSYYGFKKFMTDEYLHENPTNINKVFACYFRYKYFFIDNQSLAFDYEGHGHDRDQATECFSSPFNRYHNYFCSAFTDLDVELGSLGSYFDVMKMASEGKYDFKTKQLEINPPFNQDLMNLATKLALKTFKRDENDYEMTFILPDWPDFDAIDMLLAMKDTNYTDVKVDRYRKGNLPFKNYFTGATGVGPCHIIIIKLTKKATASLKKPIEDDSETDEEDVSEAEKVNNNNKEPTEATVEDSDSDVSIDLDEIET